MLFQIIYRSEGSEFATPCLTETQKDNFIGVLSNAGIQFEVLEREDKKTNVVSGIFKLDDTKTYVFEDPSNAAKPGDIVEVELVDGRRKNLFVKASGLKTKDEIKAYCLKIGYPTLGKVIRVVWSPKRK